MKRDWNTIRRLLTLAEATPDAASVVSATEAEGVDAEKAAHHIRLLIDAGLADGECYGADACYLRGLTWAGCELLDAIRRESAWNRIREAARERGLDLTLDVVKALAIKITERML